MRKYFSVFEDREGRARLSHLHKDGRECFVVEFGIWDFVSNLQQVHLASQIHICHNVAVEKRVIEIGIFDYNKLVFD